MDVKLSETFFDISSIISEISGFRAYRSRSGVMIQLLGYTLTLGYSVKYPS